MNPGEHDIISITDAPGGVALVCACSHRVVRPTKEQADAAMAAYHGIAQSRKALGGDDGA